MNHFLKLIKNKNFLYLWGSATLSQITINMLSFLILTRIFERTNSSIATSIVWVSYAMAAIIFGPFGGAFADIANRRKIMRVTTLSQSITVLIYSLIYHRHFYLGYGVVFLYSMFNQFYVPAEAATLPSIVSKDTLPAANGILFITVQTSLVLGLVLAGVFYETIGFEYAFFLTSILLFVAFLCVSFLPKARAKDVLPHNFEKGVHKMISEFLEGYYYIKGNSTILYPFLLLIGLQVSLSILVILMPVMATEILQIRASSASFLVVIPAAIGALVGTVIVNKLLVSNFRKKDLITLGLSTLSITILLISDIVPLVPFWIGRTAAVFGFAVAGFSYVSTLIPTITFLQEQTPGGLLGRVLGNIWFISAIATVIPILFAATVAELFGVSLTLTMVGIAGIVGVVIFRYHSQFKKVYEIIRLNKKL